MKQQSTFLARRLRRNMAAQDLAHSPEPVLERLPPLAPAVAGRQPGTIGISLRLTHDAAGDESTDFRDRAEVREPCAFLTVYAINAAVLLFAFPLGFALLVFNILGGENLRTTSHVMGLTGLATALPTLGLNVPFLT